VRLASTFYGQRERTEHEVSVAPIVLLVVLGSGIPPESGVTRASCSLPVLTEALEASRFKEILSRFSLRNQTEPVIKMVHPPTGNVR
jgi:hypothetical protein